MLLCAGTIREAGVVQRAYEFNASILTIQAQPDRCVCYVYSTYIFLETFLTFVLS